MTNWLRETEPSKDEKRRLERIAMLLKFLPTEGDDEFEELTEWEQEFLPSVREQFEKKGNLSLNQEEHLEAIWEKVN